jgi:uncharacterized protein YutE (UPF0331/DUF86 family)
LILRPDVVRERLRKLRAVLRNLYDVRAVSAEEYVSSFRHQWLAERGLQLAAEAFFDIGNHILAGHFNVHPRDYEDIIRLLAEQRVISDDLVARLQGLGGLRNILVHAYLDIDPGRVFEALSNRVDDFVQFASEVERFLDAED